MPEGDSVFRTAAQLHQALAGRRLTAAELRVPAHATAELTGRQVLDVTPRGKHLLTRLEGGLTLHTHLRMDGRWHIYRGGERWSGGPAHQIRAVLGTEECTAVGYRLPVVRLLRTADEDEAVGHLGPDLLGPHWQDGGPEEALRRLAGAPERPAGEALLDQRNLAGIGNVYAAELCFLAGVTPWTPFGELPAPERLVALAHRLLQVNRMRPGHITTGEPRPDRSHWVYGRAGQPCRRCGSMIRTARQGAAPRQRVAFWCPSCQRGPGPDGAEPR
ncbi:DNA glycosylase [Kitasatospora sp. NBC_01287]|uniref:DNA-formamidopyrimidine glycosylase family protein n=1 Tax=Kitasatospora sp. NBC_01287 TaxID=2903573 RepID=UPI002254FFDF|nr:DNA-formamidopyrimidine glycosylase family protein [Kitasatospora sp. NBC_01287]MCX4751385.1 DNA glycosylase [Kitasatospora sp. NBC_01287]